MRARNLVPGRCAEAVETAFGAGGLFGDSDFVASQVAVAHGDGEGVGDVGRFGQGWQIQLATDGLLHLPFGGVAGAGDCGILSDMETSAQFLPPEIEAAVTAQHGGPVSVTGEHGQYVVMRADLYGGILEATPEELSDSVAAIKRSLAQAAVGRTRDADVAFDQLEARYGS